MKENSLGWERNAIELIEKRRSVRTFRAEPLKDEDREAILSYAEKIQNPFGVEVTFQILSAKEHSLSSAVIVGAEEYLAAKVKRQPYFEAAFGYSFEKACLYALSRGVGTVMLAASLSRTAFERAIALKEGEVMPVASPLGYPAEKMSLRERVMRGALKADERKPFESLFFEEDFSHPLTREAAKEFTVPLEMAQKSPSAANGQPTRAIVKGNEVHFYEAKSMKDSPLGDVQKLDVGIALAHFDLAREELGIRGKFVVEKPKMQTKENFQYVATFRREE